jgi:hypothetical protein
MVFIELNFLECWYCKIIKVMFSFRKISEWFKSSNSINEIIIENKTAIKIIKTFLKSEINKIS